MNVFRDFYRVRVLIDSVNVAQWARTFNSFGNAIDLSCSDSQIWLVVIIIILLLYYCSIIKFNCPLKLGKWGDYVRGFTFVGEFHSLGKYNRGGFSFVWEFPLWGNNISGGISFAGDLALSGITRNNQKNTLKLFQHSNRWEYISYWRIVFS